MRIAVCVFLKHLPGAVIARTVRDNDLPVKALHILSQERIEEQANMLCLVAAATTREIETVCAA